MKPTIDGYIRSQTSQPYSLSNPPPPPPMSGASLLAPPTSSASAYDTFSPYCNASKIRMVNRKKGIF